MPTAQRGHGRDSDWHSHKTDTPCFLCLPVDRALKAGLPFMEHLWSFHTCRSGLFPGSGDFLGQQPAWVAGRLPILTVPWDTTLGVLELERPSSNPIPTPSSRESLEEWLHLPSSTSPSLQGDNSTSLTDC